MARISRRVILAAAPLLPLAPYLTRSLFGQRRGGGKAQLFVGTYTHDMGAGGKGEGIYTAEWDAAAGRLTPLRLAMKTTDPSFLAVPPSGEALYAVNEREDYPQGNTSAKGGSVTAFRRDAATGELSQQNVLPCGGTDPCHVAVDRANQAVFVADYSSGALASYRVTADGISGPVSLFGKQFASKGLGPNKQRQESPHIHCVTLSPDERFLLVNDLGTDHIWIFRVDLQSATLTETNSPWHAKPGSGPRHTHFHPNGRWVYSINELTSTVDLLAWNATAGTLTWHAEFPLRDPAFTGESTGAELAIDRRGAFLYASNRGENVLVVFSIDPGTGALNFVQRIGCGGQKPRDFTLDPSERWLVAANQDTQNIVVFARDPHSGKLTQTDRSAHVGAPVAVLFV
ncbi:MAG TPA: lactonase family protein [Acidobacteriaceae bacterium]